jgi:hypothetical protein
MGEVLVNAWAVVVCAAMYMVLGMLWYSPVLFAGPWIRMAEMTPEKMRSPAVPMVLSLICAPVSSLGLALIVGMSGADSAANGALLGLLIGFGILALMMLPTYLFEQRPLMLYLINAGYPVVYVVASCAILGAWQ